MVPTSVADRKLKDLKFPVSLVKYWRQPLGPPSVVSKSLQENWVTWISHLREKVSLLSWKTTCWHPLPSESMITGRRHILSGIFILGQGHHFWDTLDIFVISLNRSG